MAKALNFDVMNTYTMSRNPGNPGSSFAGTHISVDGLRKGIQLPLFPCSRKVQLYTRAYLSLLHNEGARNSKRPRITAMIMLDT